MKKDGHIGHRKLFSVSARPGSICLFLCLPSRYWIKVKNLQYSQLEGREESFEQSASRLTSRRFRDRAISPVVSPNTTLTASDQNK